jgi:hypothetical protein
MLQANSFFIRIDRPEYNNLLRSPLAESADGTQRCGRAVFADTGDTDYQRILNAFRQRQQQLQERPRIDMVRLTDQQVSYP